jgi:leucine dehydrogenase
MKSQDVVPLPHFERCLRFEIEGKVGFIIIHNTVLGPALGGLRVKRYSSEAECFSDCARLARGMSYKNSASGFSLGGGKAAVNASSEEITHTFLKEYGELVASLRGEYITAPDFGTDVRMMDVIAQKTRYVTCLSPENGGLGDPSPFTARGVFLSLEKAVNFLGLKKERSLRVLLQGYGKVGKSLASLLREAGYKVIVSEISEERKNQAKKDGFWVVEREKFYETPAEIFSPNGSGGVVNPETILLLKKAGVKLICGGANNQLAETEREVDLLRNEEIWYIPDFIANAGGVALAYTEWRLRQGEIKKEEVETEMNKLLEKIAKRVGKILQSARGRGLTTMAAAERLAEETVADHGGRLR